MEGLGVMAGGLNGSFDFSELEAYLSKTQALLDSIPGFCETMAKQLAQELLSRCIKRTPVQTGNLKRNWLASSVVHKGDTYEVTVENSTLYASYVEYGHRQQPGRYVPAIKKRLKKYWVIGKFMMTISANEIKSGADAAIASALQKHIEGMLQ